MGSRFFVIFMTMLLFAYENAKTVPIYLGAMMWLSSLTD
ncbi:Sigma-fimbriae tip adhesin [gamma proteobacterium IMCC2047]|nr:Sigma-fimbriae tip adhesin [gamma proteobacterium IMCC2047]